MRSTQLAPSVLRLVQGGPGYPACLGALPDPPRQLFCIGDLTALGPAPEALVAIVGTREATLYGLRVATALGRAFAEAGAIVVSGMARGVDSAAHDAAIKAGGKAIAVLGTGPDVPYPVANRELHSRMAAGGLIVSESEPGTKAFQGCFPRRNRIIAASLGCPEAGRWTGRQWGLPRLRSGTVFALASMGWTPSARGQGFLSGA